MELLRYLYDHPVVEITGVAWRPNTKASWWGAVDVADAARELGLPIFDPNKDDLEPDLDILFSVYYDRIISKALLDIPRLGGINLHGALLPEYRGRFTFLHAILHDEKEYGATLHFMDEGADTGDIIATRRFDVDDKATARSLYDVTAREGIQLFKESLPSIIDGSVKGVPQGPGTYSYRSGDIPDGEVDLSWDPDYIDRFVRAMYFPPYAPAFLKIGEKKFFLHPDTD
jgi:methionyl-tRNA formyltransferase